ncbi:MULTISPECIES: D-alanyl-D-alanine carboxypeptidase family protein [Brevibacillus]|uniref:D-alanyl-D-alanine carboxypeptidase family protein n=1 Tax=Brevibacillus TaxID=55080 RepID=UPI0002E6DE17|nr:MULTISPECIES: D-alanyl-D-alanine carboxypeptidase family protein [Brevibacillus]AUM64703.1 D-alanyl-D-alanine carboxypeptidase [Brevibacillus laterosporus]AYK07623.1 D-alanyl-D-alanine carboxypeptidase [Brevibacillus laterosporus]MBA4535098.1 D-alanyl-D-alanine carboxypeptidase [Brevibacillus halotolerans]MCR8965921.1 D-alanyl-D-alanine carboxypeptidase [Brevibacillus laterosporus]MCZ0838077.1 D-alanyl-D-alanine carboxypeptidase [Brevibacillus halotolerans]
MKRLLHVFLCLVTCITMLTPGLAYAEESKPNMAPHAKSAILMEADSGTILFEKNAHEKLPPASITKVMTLLLIFEAMERGEVKLTDKVRTSERAASMGGSQIFLQPGEEMTVEDMVKGIAIASGNDAAVAMAEHIGGTEEAFIKKMNERAAQLGLKNTHFINCNGLPSPDHYTTASDIAIMSRELLKHEIITKYTGIYQDYLRKDSASPFWLVNTNRLVRFYDGVDGLKTGYTSEAKFCITATAKRKNMRVIAVVLGEPDTKVRNKEITGMFDYAFNHYQVHPIYKKGDVIQQLSLDKGEETKVNVVTEQPVSLLLKKGENPNAFVKEITLASEAKAPIKKSNVVGHIFIKKNGKEVARIDLYPEKTVERANMWDILKRTTQKVMFTYR